MKTTRKIQQGAVLRLGMVALISLPALGSLEVAQAQPNLSTASFSGTYARFGNDGQAGAGLGTCVATVGDPTQPPDPGTIMDPGAMEPPATGGGSFVCEGFVLSGLGDDNAIPTTLTASFSVNPNGSGSFNETLQFPDGSSIDTVSDFVITRLIPGTGIAQEIYAVQRQDGPSGGLVTSTFKRLSD